MSAGPPKPAENNEELGVGEDRDLSKVPEPDGDLIWQQAKEQWPEAFERMRKRKKARKKK